MIKKPSNWIEQRLTVLTEIRNNEPERDWTVREVADAMKQHPLVKQFQPTYGKSTAARDIALINEQLVHRREELAQAYIHAQLELTDEIIEDLVDEYRKLTESDFEDIEKFIKTKVTLSKAILLTQRRQASILPIDAPKKLSIESSHRFDIEHFYQIQQGVNNLMLDDPTVVDGEFELD
jgi:hypothetical protein